LDVVEGEVGSELALMSVVLRRKIEMMKEEGREGSSASSF